MKMRNLFLAATIIATGFISQVGAEDDPKKLRHDGFEQNKDDMKVISGLIKDNKGADDIATRAKRMAEFAKQIPALFPENSHEGTEALPTIWEKWSMFEAIAGENANAATKLADLAERGDFAAMQESFQQLGGTCKSCHQNFRK